MKRVWIVIIVGLLFLSFDLPKSASKKIHKTLQSIWPEQIFTKKPIHVTNLQKGKLSFNPSDNFYHITKDNNTIAYMCLSNASSKVMTFDYMLVFNPDLSILKIKMLIYREDYGGEIGSKRWLKQFYNKNNPENLKFGHDVQNISGATISARNMTQDVKKVMKQIHELKRVGAI